MQKGHLRKLKKYHFPGKKGLTYLQLRVKINDGLWKIGNKINFSCGTICNFEQKNKLKIRTSAQKIASKK